MADSISRTFAHWAANLTYEDLPPEVVDKVKGLMLHMLTSVAIGGASEEGKHAVEHVLHEESRPDGATILVDGRRATRIGATFADAEMMHASSLIDSYRMLTHPGPVLIPIAMVNGELEKRSGKEVITALAAGYEFLFRLCDDFIPSTAARGFRPGPIYGTMGGAMVAGKSMGLDEGGLLATIGLATHLAGGIFGGGSEQGIHEPNAARQGMFAAVMARTGAFKGSEHSLDGDPGFYQAFTGSSKGKLTWSFKDNTFQVDPATITEGLGKDWKVLDAMFRMYPTSGYNQPVIDLIVEMMRQQKITSDDIDIIDVHMNHLETNYPTPEFSRMSAYKPEVGQKHWYYAQAAVYGGVPVVGGRDFAPAGTDIRTDPKLIDFMNQHVRVTPVWGKEMFGPSVIIRTKDGRAFFGDYPYRRLAWTFDELVPRLNECVPGVPGGQATFDRLVEAVRGSDALASVEPLHAALKR